MSHAIAVIGAGRIGKIHARNVAAAGLRLRYIVDVAADEAARLASDTGAEPADLATVLADPQVAGVVVASSTDTHLDYAVRAIGAGKAVFCEKPLDLDLARCRAARDVLGAKGARLLMGFNRRFDPHFAALKRRIDEGAIGRLESLQITSHDPAPPPIAYVKVSGGLFKDMAIHDFDMARWLLGEEPVEIFAAGSCLVDPAIGEAGDVDTARTILRTASGRLCLVSNTRRSAYGYDQRIEAFGSEGLAKADNVTENTTAVWRAAGAAQAPFQNFFLERYAEAYRREMAHFAAILEGRQAPSVGYEDALAALAIAEAAAQSARTDASVRL
jgi:myo-inositol 2-dehydrogenase/D-chiro-inositol 1-dehydrogenase